MPKSRPSLKRRRKNKAAAAGDSPAQKPFSRRGVLASLGAVSLAAVGIVSYSYLFGGGQAQASDVVVYKSPSCGCCGKWVSHLRRHGFRVSVHNVDDVDPVKSRAGVPYDLQSCHTALVDNYVIEGHVPADSIVRMLNSQPPIKGLAVPGMPMGSPGMEGPDRESYNVYAFNAKKQSAVFASY